MKSQFQPWQFLLLILAGWINRRQQDAVEYLITENRILREKLGKKRILLNDDQRRRLAVKGKILGRKVLEQLATIVTPETILRWHRELVAQEWDYGGRCRRVGRPPTSQEIVGLLLRMAAKIRVGVLMTIGESTSIQTISDVYKHRFQPDNDDQRRFRSCETLMAILEQHSFFTPSRLRPGVFKAAAKTQKYTRLIMRGIPMLNRHTATLVAFTLSLSWASPHAQVPSAESEKWEEAFRDQPLPANIREYARRLSARPHHVGSTYDKDNAEWLMAKFKEWGWDASIERFDVLFPTPKERVLELIAPARFTAKLEEPAVPEDPTSGQKSEQLPTYNAYSTDGDVTGPLVYVNYGRPVDYEQLDRLGISVKGAVVIARYGAAWRGIKPKVAAEHGAIGCLIYSDPRDDGYFNGDVFPEGPMRNRDGVQRGSVMDMPLYPGDPLTPGVGATPEAKRLAIKDARSITKIPVLPISYGDAQPLLTALKGATAPLQWRGALPLTYHIGPGPATVHLRLAFNWDIKPLYDVLARIPGSLYPDEWIVRGNHHDAWVNGTADPVSALSAELEEARVLGEMHKKGWQPKRTIVYAAWDGEEPALLGSTEWVEEHGPELERKAVVYINTDSNSRGYLSLGGSHSLERFINAVAKAVEDPEAKVSAWKRLQSLIIATGSAEERKEARSREDLRIGALGSGSDFTPFLQHNGVPTLNLGFGGEDQDGIYHSIYDDFYHYTKFHDPEFIYGRALAQTVGTAVIRLAAADVLPFEFTNLADTVNGYVKELQALLKERQDAARERNRQIEEGVFAAILDPRRPQVTPPYEEVPPSINFAPLENASTALSASAQRYRKALAAASSQLQAHPGIVQSVNAKLIQSERQMLDPAGLLRREWYRHLLYAPGFYTGYGVKTIPGVREGIEQKQYKEAEAEVLRAARALEREAALIDATAAELERASTIQPKDR